LVIHGQGPWQQKLALTIIGRMDTIENSSTAFLAAGDAYVGFVSEHRDWVPGSPPLTVRHLPTRTIFELVLPHGRKLGDVMPFREFDARLVHVGIGARCPSKLGLAALACEAVLVRLHQHGIVRLFDEEGLEVPQTTMRLRPDEGRSGD
jgi:hypothetical protein